MALVAPHVSGTDICMACQVALADVLHSVCGHRVLCNDCLQSLATNVRRRTGRSPMCPTCRVEMDETAIQLRRDLQLEETKVCDADPADNILPYGALLDFRRGADDGEMYFADTQTMARVSQAVRACSRGELSVPALCEALDGQLNGAERELAFVELNKHVDLHQTLVDIDRSLMCRDGLWATYARHMVQRTVEGQDGTGMAARSAVGVVADVVVVGAFGFSSLSHTNAATNLVVCLILSSIDVYRWSKGDITWDQLACNIGEHTVGCSAALGGSIGGAALGSMVGGPLAPVTMILGALLGGFFGDFTARRTYRGAITACTKGEETEDEARLRAINDAAVTLGVDLQRDGFALAKRKFRRMILHSHPDRAPAGDALQNAAEAARIIAAWQIVRGHYEARNQLGDGDGNKEPEALIIIWVMKTRRSANAAWEVVRTWFGEMDNAPVHHGQNEIVERKTVYM